MRVAIQQVKDGAAQAAVSAGNTGALMAHRALPAQDARRHRPARHRPAAAQRQGRRHDGAGPRRQRRLRREQHLLQFAVLGSALVSALTGNEQPTVGLLNIGEEAIKGNEIIKKASELLRTAANSRDLNFYGNVEGNDIFKGTTDIVVCDGFVGNVALKTSEGVASMIVDFLRRRVLAQRLHANLRRSSPIRC